MIQINHEMLRFGMPATANRTFSAVDRISTQITDKLHNFSKQKKNIELRQQKRSLSHSNGIYSDIATEGTA